MLRTKTYMRRRVVAHTYVAQCFGAKIKFLYSSTVMVARDQTSTTSIELNETKRNEIQMHYAELSRNAMASPPEVTRLWPLLTHLVLSRNPLKGRRHQSLRLLQAAQRGHDAMHKGVSSRVCVVVRLICVSFCSVVRRRAAGTWEVKHATRRSIVLSLLSPGRLRELRS